MGHEGVGGIRDTLFGKPSEVLPQVCNYSLQRIPLNKSLLDCWGSDFPSAEQVVAPVNRLDNRITFPLHTKLVQSTCLQTVNFISWPE